MAKAKQFSDLVFEAFLAESTTAIALASE